VVSIFFVYARYFDVKSSIKIGLAFRAMTETFSTEPQLKSLLTFFDQNKYRLGATLGGVRLSVQTVKANVVWVKKYSKEVSDWFKHAV